MAKASDNPFPSLLLVEQASAPATPGSGHARLYRGTDDKLYVVDDAGTSTEVGGSGGGGGAVWQDYTPTLTATTTNPTLGSGSTAVGRYCDDGETVRGWAAVFFGTSGVSAGSGTYVISLPVAMNANTFSGAVALHGAVGAARIRDVSSGVDYAGVATARDVNSLSITIPPSSTVTNSIPFSWAASDRFMVEFCYEKE